MNKNELYIQRCLQLAQKGLGLVSPNPMVGALLVANNQIIGEGWHKQYGRPHAEVNALKAVPEHNRHLISNSTLYVTLEPCNHQGKTPPCVDLILENKITKVVIASVDSNSEVKGKGIERLRENGVEVITGLLNEQSRHLNRRFFTFHEKKRPYIILKWAQTKDYFFAKKDKKQHWITNQLSKKLVHKWRSEEDAILVGTNTVKIDNPQLTNRFFEEKKQPVRVVLDRNLSIPKTHHIFDQSTATILVNEEQNSTKNNLQYCQFLFDNNLFFRVLQTLHKQNVQSIIIEGGSMTLQYFINQNLWDEARILTGNKDFKTGISAPKIHGETIEKFMLKDDQIQIIKNTKCTI